MFPEITGAWLFVFLGKAAPEVRLSYGYCDKIVTNETVSLGGVALKPL